MAQENGERGTPPTTLDAYIPLLSSAVPQVREHAARTLGNALGKERRSANDEDDDNDWKGQLLALSLTSKAWHARAAASSAYSFAVAARMKGVIRDVLDSDAKDESNFPFPEENDESFFAFSRVRSPSSVLQEASAQKFKSTAEVLSASEASSVRKQIKRLGECFENEAFGGVAGMPSATNLRKAAASALGLYTEPAITHRDVAESAPKAAPFGERPPKRQRVPTLSIHEKQPAPSLWQSWDSFRKSLNHENWETRHGGALGLRSCLQGIFAASPSIERMNPRRIASCSACVTDAMVRALCALMQERFSDFASVAAVSPVREMCSQVLAVGARCIAILPGSSSKGDVDNLIRTLCALAHPDEAQHPDSASWDIRHAALVALKYFIISYSQREGKFTEWQRVILCAAERSMSCERDDVVRAAGTTLARAVWLSAPLKVRGETSELCWKALQLEDLLSPVVDCSLELLKLLVDCKAAQFAVRPLLPFLTHPSGKTRILAFSLAGSIGACLQLGGKIEDLGDFARLCFAALQSLCVETDAVLEAAEQTWEKLVNACTASPGSLEVIRTLLSPEMLHRHWFPLACGNRQESLPRNFVSYVSIEQVRGSNGELWSSWDPSSAFFLTYVALTKVTDAVLPCSSGAAAHSLSKGIAFAIRHSSISGLACTATSNLPLIVQQLQTQAEAQKSSSMHHPWCQFALTILFYVALDSPPEFEMKTVLFAPALKTWLVSQTSAYYNIFLEVETDAASDSSPRRDDARAQLKHHAADAVLCASSCIAWYGCAMLPSALNSPTKAVLSVFNLSPQESEHVISVAGRALWVLVKASRVANRPKLTETVAALVLRHFDRAASTGRVSGIIMRTIAALEGSAAFDFLPNLYAGTLAAISSASKEFSRDARRTAARAMRITLSIVRGGGIHAPTRQLVNIAGPMCDVLRACDQASLPDLAIETLKAMVLDAGSTVCRAVLENLATPRDDTFSRNESRLVLAVFQEWENSKDEWNCAPDFATCILEKCLASMLSYQNACNSGKMERGDLAPECALFAKIVAAISGGGSMVDSRNISSQLFEESEVLLRAKQRGVEFVSTLLQLSDRTQSLRSLVDVDVYPENLLRSLRPYQQDGIAWLINLFDHGLSGALCDDLGLGKTLMVIAALRVSLVRTKVCAPFSIVIAPSSCMWHWCGEIKRWFGRARGVTFEPVVVCGTQARRRTMLQNAALKRTHEKERHVVLILSYGSIRSDVDVLLANAKQCHCVVLDEAHTIRNPSSKTAQACYKAGSIGKFRLAVTGTPIHNSIVDIWGVFQFLLPGYLGNISDFKRAYAPLGQSIDQKNAVDLLLFGKRAKLLAVDTAHPPAAPDAKNAPALAAQAEQEEETESDAWKKLEELHGMLKPFVLRRNKCEVLADLPPKIVQDVVLSPVSVQDNVYKELLPSAATHGGEAGMHAFKRLRNLLLACTHPLLALRSMLRDASSEVGKISTNRMRLLKLRKLLSRVKSMGFAASCKFKAVVQILRDGSSAAQTADDLQSASDSSSDGSASESDSSEGSLDGSVDSQSDTEVGVDVTAASDSSGSIPGGSFGRGCARRSRQRQRAFQRAVVFSQWKSTLDLFEEQVLKEGMPLCRLSYSRIDGSTNVSKRQEIVDVFNAAQSDIDVLLVTTGAGGQGLNLIGGNVVIFLDLSWNPQVDLQAMDRCHRIGQKRSVVVYRLLVKETAESQLMGSQIEKLATARVVVGGGNEAGNDEGSTSAGKESAGGVLGKFIASRAASGGPGFASTKRAQGTEPEYVQEHDLAAFMEMMQPPPEE